LEAKLAPLVQEICLLAEFVNYIGHIFKTPTIGWRNKLGKKAMCKKCTLLFLISRSVKTLQGWRNYSELPNSCRNLEITICDLKFKSKKEVLKCGSTRENRAEFTAGFAKSSKSPEAISLMPLIPLRF